MAKDRLSSKLAVILHADVVGSTELVQQDKQLAHERIQDTFQRFSDTIGKYQGHVVELRGDALLAEFERASDAVSAALSFQSDHTYHISRLKDDLRPTVRVGITMGEVIVADSTVTGAGVVQAQRVEQLADSGGVCVTAAIHEALSKRMPFNLEDLGEQVLKGFDIPVRVYRVELSANQSIPIPQHDSKNETSPNKPNFWVATIVIALVVAGGAAYWFKMQEPKVEAASIERMAFPLPDKPSIAVLPFTNMSDDAEQQYFADGMTEDLITDLSKISGLFVIARNSVFFYKDKQIKIRDVAEELGVRYVLEGSVRRADNVVRINAQLIDTMTGGHLWADRYDGSLADIFSLQDQVTREIVTALAVNLTGSEISDNTETNNIEAYDAFLKGWNHYQRQTPQDFSEALRYFEHAVELDRDYSRAYAALSALYWETHTRDWYPALQISHIQAKQRAYEYRDLAMSNPTPLALVVSADILMWHGKHDSAITLAKRAIKMSRSDAHSHLKLAEILAYAGMPQAALNSVAISKRLDPHGKPRQLYVQGLAEFGLDQFSQAATALEQALELNPGFAKPITILAASYGYLGQQDAAVILKPYKNEYFASSVSTASVQFPFKHDEDRNRFAEGLRKAGLKEFD